MWWRDGLLYQVYPRSFADSDGDGIGDLRGITARLDHLEWLGVDGLWLNPTFPSPNADWGFDVSDYRGVHPELGTLEDLDELVARAGERGIRVLLDLVPNHTSDQHPWFRERRDFYVWREGRNGEPPNNWKSTFGGPAWTRDEASGEWYLHNFTPEQPDLDWWNEDVRAEFDDILRFWMDRGIAGFRIDVAHGIVKDRELRDNPPATDDDIDHHRWLGQRLLVLRQPRGGPRRLPPLARGGRPARGGARGRDVGARPAQAHALLRRGPRRAAPGLQLRLPARATSRRRSSRRSSPRPRRCCPSTRGRCGRWATTTWPASRPAGRAATPGSRAVRSCCC